jgi:6-pyruvoyltetrahydropterin/6-carboxytetrahydropterin synthase
MYRVTREIRFCYGHRILGHEGKCRHLHGHNGRAVIVLEAPHLDALGMVVDFARIKQVVGGWVNDKLDHKMILRRDDPALAVLRQQGEPVFALDDNPTAEGLAKLIYDFTCEAGFPVVEVHLWETDDSYASYRSQESGVRGQESA